MPNALLSTFWRMREKRDIESLPDEFSPICPAIIKVRNRLAQWNGRWFLVRCTRCSELVKMLIKPRFSSKPLEKALAASTEDGPTALPTTGWKQGISRSMSVNDSRVNSEGAVSNFNKMMSRAPCLQLNKVESHDKPYACLTILARGGGAGVSELGLRLGSSAETGTGRCRFASPATQCLLSGFKQ